MSKQIDERVVSMQFDNQRFEQNVKTSMSTLDKLKQKLNLTGASKGLENVQSAAKKVDMSGLSNSVETVRTKFSALEVMGVTALANITNSAVNAGKKMVSALTIDPIKSGFNEYETQMNAVQTILANTQSKGSTLDDVNKALDTLNTYADKTIYNFTEMTRNIGTFTAAGVDLQTSVDSIQGIANLAAVSGSSSQQASTAMYQLSQALAAGRVSLMDWNSVVNAGMGGELFQNALLRTSELLKTGGKEAVKTYGSFRESLTKGQWLTKDVLTETLKQMSGAYTEADLIAQGFTKEQAKEITSLAQTATDAATKVKTFSQLWDVMKESAQSGWAQTWKLIIGDFEQAKALLTPLANFFTGVIGKMSDARNKLLESALGKSFTSLGKKIKGALKPIEGTANAIGKVSDAVKDYGKVVDEIIGGKWGNGQARWDKLATAGYDWAHAQNLVNEKLGDSTRHTTKYKEAQDEATKSSKKSTEASGNLTKAQAKTVEQLIALSDAELKAKGYTDEQIKAFRELEALSKKLGIPIRELVTNLDKINGRWLLINSFKNIGSSIVKIFKSIGEAWRDAFPPMTSNQLFNIIAGFHKLSTKLKMSDETADKLTRTFKGVFAILDIVFTLIGGPIKIAFKILGKVLGAFGVSILDVTAFIGDAIVRFRNWLDSTLDFTKVFALISPYVKKAVNAVKEWIKETKPLEKVAHFIKKVAIAVKDLAIAFKNSKYFDIGVNIIKGLANGIKNGIVGLWNIITSVAKGLIDKVKSILGIHSPSLVFMAIGGFIIAGLLLGIQNGAPEVWATLKDFGLKCVDIIKNIDFGAVLAAATSVGLMVAANKIGGALLNFSAPFEALGDFLENVGQGVEKWLKADALLKKAKAVKEFALAIGILVAAVWVLTLIKPKDLWSAIGAIFALSVILAVLSVAISKLNGLNETSLSKTGLNVKKTVASIIPIALSLLLLTIALKQLAGISVPDLVKGGIVIAALGGMLVGLIAATKLVGPDVAQTGKTLFKISLIILLLVYTIKQIAKLDGPTLGKGIGCMILFGGFVVGLLAATKLAGPNVDGMGVTIFKLSLAILLLVFTARIIGSIDAVALNKGIKAIIVFSTIIAGLIAITHIAGGKEIGKIGSTIIGFSTAMLIMAFAVGILGRMEITTLVKGLAAIYAFGGIITALIHATKDAGDVKKLASTILAASIAIGILAGVAVLLGLVKLDHLAKGLIAIGIISAMMIGLIKATKDATTLKGPLIVLTVAIAVLAIAIAALSAINPANLASASAALSAVIGMFALLIKTTSSVGKVKTSIGPLLLMTTVVLVLAGVLYALSVLKVNVALETALSLAVLMGVMTGVLKALNKIDTNVKKAAKGATGLVLLCAPLLTIAWSLKQMKGVKTSIKTVTSISILMGVMTGVLAVLSKIKISVGKAIKGTIGLLALCVPLLGIALILKMMNGVKNATENAKALSLLMVAMTVVLGGLTIIGTFATSALLGVVALLALAVPLLAFVGILALMEMIPNAEANANLLIKLTSVMTVLLVALAIVGPLALIGVTALAALTGLMTAIGVLVVAIGAIMEKFPILKRFLDTGLNVLIKLAGGIGEMIGAFVKGALTKISDGLPKIGDNLSKFINNASDFIEKSKKVNSDVLEGVGILTASIIALTVTDFIDSIKKFLTFGSSFADLGTDLSNFINNADDFMKGVKNLTPESMTAFKNLADAILVLTSNDVIDGLTSWFTGGASLVDFGKELEEFAPSLVKFSDIVKDIDNASVKVAAEATRNLADAVSKLPNEGGALAWLAGDNTMDKFADNLKPLAEGIVAFSNEVKGNVDKTSVQNACDSLKLILAMSEDIQNEGGALAWFIGDNTLDKLATDLAPLAEGITNFSKIVEGNVNKDSVKNACDSMKHILDMSENIQNEGGALAWFIGDNTLDDFGDSLVVLGSSIYIFSKYAENINKTKVDEAASAARILLNTVNDLPEEFNISVATLLQFPILGKSIKLFSDQVKDISVTNVDIAANACSTIAGIAKTAPKDSSNLSAFAKKLPILGEAIQSFVYYVGGTSAETVDTATDAITKIDVTVNAVNYTKFSSVAASLDTMTNALKGLSEVKTSTVSGFTEAIRMLAETDINSASNAFSVIRDKMKGVGQGMVMSFNEGLTSKIPDITSAIAKMASRIKSSITSTGKAATKLVDQLLKQITKTVQNNKSSFESAGKDLGSGLVKGINAKKPAVYKAAYLLGQSAVQGEKDGQKSNSPSKLTIQSGKWFGEGLVIGINRMIKPVSNSAYGLGETATETISTAVSKITDLVNSDIDAQPTIRPVLDLSDVKSGMGSMNGLFSGRTLSVNMAGVGSLSASMANRQNGNGSSEIVSSIKALRKDIANMPREGTTINGMTYSAGTEVDDAVKTLIRAINIERRS